VSDYPQPAGLAQPPVYPPPVVTQDERTMATLAHALQVVGWWIAPLIIFFLKPESKFVRFHSLQAMLLQFCIMLFWMVGMVLFFVGMFATIPHGRPGPGQMPPLFMLVVPILWLGGMLIWIVTLVLAIVYAIKAGQGEWAGYPIIGGIARRFLGL
jgi:uncharacterized membrane protein